MARLIDADELLEHVYRDRLDSRERIAEMIKNAPTVAQMEKEPKKGYWIKYGKYRECSECNAWSLKDTPRHCYCPNCGSYNGDLEWR